MIVIDAFRNPHRTTQPNEGQAIVYTFVYTFVMLIETLSVREARDQLSCMLERFRRGDRTPVGVGSHRKTEAVMVPVEVFEELTTERVRSLEQAMGSIRAEGLEPSPDAEAIVERWTRGEITTAQMRELGRRLHTAR
ncbi:antitoxin VbhA family protein [Nocardia suismassiliense]|uniref:antitoxin VbhA family protein n=1 Tax=Nocardia suismassiliense TaxID=2077092 RepID=UPI00131EEC5E|nr:antitoxin VbhA family protein [Nocardia suismassiliense]